MLEENKDRIITAVFNCTFIFLQKWGICPQTSNNQQK